MARSSTRHRFLQTALPCSWPYDLIFSVLQAVRNRCYRRIILCLGVGCVELELAWHYSWSHHGQLDNLGKLCDALSGIGVSSCFWICVRLASGKGTVN
jgi:hypothetical protein